VLWIVQFVKFSEGFKISKIMKEMLLLRLD